MTEPLGIYIHIPFCRSKCDYCDFYSLAGCGGEKMDLCQKALLAHIREAAPTAADRQVDTVYFGGGTPSYYGAKRLAEVLKTLKKHYHLAKDCEITVEANPDTADFRTLRALRRAGVNRVSLGVQSACDRDLAALHRVHTFAQAAEAVAAARKAKLHNVSLDLIYGLPGQTMAAWQETVEAALALEPEHLSCYGLKVEEGTPLWERRETADLPDDDTQADEYLWTVERLARAGYTQYEISNFAKPGRASRHNLKYWTLGEYMGFGPAAHSDFGGRRYGYLRDLDGYIDGVLRGGRIVAEEDLIPKKERGGEYLMLGLRTVNGIEEWEYRSRYFMEFAPVEGLLREYAQRGWAVREENGRWHFTPEGFLLSNQLIGSILEVQEEAKLEEVLPLIRRRRAMERGTAE